MNKQRKLSPELSTESEGVDVHNVIYQQVGATPH